MVPGDPSSHHGNYDKHLATTVEPSQFGYVKEQKQLGLDLRQMVRYMVRVGKKAVGCVA